MPSQPVVGDAVVFEGLPSRIVAISGNKVEFVSDLKVEGKDVPRFRTVAALADLLFSSRLNAWYVWGRVLSKGRGARVDPASGTVIAPPVADQRAIAARLRDMGVIPSRDGRRFGDAPAPGEQHGLFCDLFADGAVDWNQEVRNVRLQEGLSQNAVERAGNHLAGFRSKPLNHGFADRDDGDPGFDSVKKGV